jgi:hypothetical protein
MKVLVGCENSGTVRDVFLAAGHEALSCDLLPSDAPGPHYEGDIFDVIDYPWDLAIFHPPCTHTAVSGSKHFEVKRQDGRQYAGVSFFLNLERRSRHIPRRAFEQPVSIMSSLYRKPDQIIHPHMFGHPEFKATCLWLFNLRRLKATNQLALPKRGTPEWKAWNRVHNMRPSADRWKERSKTYQGIADAMGLFWGDASEAGRVV